MSDTDVVQRLLDRAAWHESEAERIRSAADVVAQELGVALSTTKKSRTRTSSGTTIPALMVALLDAEPREWTVTEIKDALIAQGAHATQENVRVAARRLSSRDEIVKLSRGTYVTKNRAPEPPLPALPTPAPQWFGGSDETSATEPQMAVVG